jgi:hypothetical protein
MHCMFENAMMYSHSMSNWGLKNDCSTTDFLKNVIMWSKYNDENDMPLQNGERLEIPEGLKKFWRSK